MYNLRGRKLRTLDLDYSLRGPGIGSGKRIYVGNNADNGNRVAAIDVERDYANTRWQLMTFGAVSAAPALHKGVLYIGSEDGRIYAVTETREPHWPLEGGVFLTYGSIRADIKADDFGVYVASTDSKLYCVDRSNAKVKWQYFAGAELRQSPIITPKTVYLAVPGKGVVAINKTEGKYNREPDWVVADGVQFLSEDNKYAYIRRNDNVIVAIDRETGEAAFKSKRADFDLFASNDKSDGVIYAATTNGQVMAIQPVLKPGSVGELVLNANPIESIALAKQ
jgi:outer membrane protein assembly factor BamB